MSEADLALGRLDGTVTTLPNPDLFVAMYVRTEAVLSSQIEGTQASLTDVLLFEVGDDAEHVPDIDEVVNYIKAMNHGLERLTTLPLSLRLIREIHEKLMTGVRGSERSPGEFRTSQDWIGPRGSTLESGCLVGIGATVLDGAVVESGAQVGAGAVVPPGMRVPSGKLVLGTPARVARDLTAEQQAEIVDIAARYVRLKDEYVEALGRGW